MLNEFYMQLITILKKRQVRFLVVGSYAMALYGCPRDTESLELWVEVSRENSERIHASLKEFDELPDGLEKDEFIKPHMLWKIGKNPNRIDIVTTVHGVEFQEAFNGRRSLYMEDMNIPFISREDLIKNRQITDRVLNRHDARDLVKYRSIPQSVKPWY